MSDLSDSLSPSARHLAGRYRRASLSMPVVKVFTGTLDFTLMALVQWFAFYAALPSDVFSDGLVALLSLCLAGISVVGVTLLHGYDRVRLLRVRAAAGPVVIAGAIVAAFVAMMAPAEMDQRRYFAFAAAATILGPAAVRLLLSKVMAWADDSGLMERRAVLVGGGENARRAIERLGTSGDIRVCAIFDDRSGDRSPDLVLDVPRIGRFDELVAFARAAEIDLVIITLDVSAQDRIGRLLEKFSVLPVPVHLSACSQSFSFAPGGLISLSKGTFGAQTRMRKRAFDLVFGIVALILTAPIMVLVAIAVKLESPGPVLFRQMRAGFLDRPIEVLKFRSMRQEAADPTADNLVVRGDVRVTKVGAFLRRTSIDELPQLFNVLRGELSLVGPRPHAVNARSATQTSFDAMVKGYSRRHRLPPGITGWAQIHGLRGTIEDTAHLRARVDYDLWYIENWSPMLDLMILLKTPVSLVTQTENAF